MISCRSQDCLRLSSLAWVQVWRPPISGEPKPVIPVGTCSPAPHCRVANIPAQVQSPEAMKAYEEAEPPLWTDLGTLTYPVTTAAQGGASLFRPGPQDGRQFQPCRGQAGLPQGAEPRSELRHVLPRRGAGARTQHQRADGPGSERAGHCGAQEGAGLAAGASDKEKGADRGGGGPLFGGPGGGTAQARRWLSRTPWPLCRTNIRTTSNSRCWPPRRGWTPSPGIIGSRAARSRRGGRPMSRSGWKAFSPRTRTIPGRSTSTSIWSRPPTGRSAREPYADRLAALMPGAGHIVHMPSHIYYRIGRYVDSLDVQQGGLEGRRGLHLANRRDGRLSDRLLLPQRPFRARFGAACSATRKPCSRRPTSSTSG